MKTSSERRPLENYPAIFQRDVALGWAILLQFLSGSGTAKSNHIRSFSGLFHRKFI